nr:MAG TPA: putative tail fiber protein [Bacteriophage sp.]
MIQKKSLKEAIQNPEIISVVGGLLGLNDTFFNYRGPISDLDLANKNGVYTFSSSAANSPVDGSGKCLTFGSEQDGIAQLAITWDTRLVYIRGKIGGEWKHITTA